MKLVTITSLAAGGDGVARQPDGRVVFVPHTAVGDVVEIALVSEKKTFARGLVRRIEHAGEGRREAVCALFTAGACGGCQWLHLGEDTQVAAKQAIVASALRHHIADEAIEPMRRPTQAMHWRRRARLHWVRTKAADKATIGFKALRGNRVTALDGCVQLDEALTSALARVDALLGPHLHKQGEIDVILLADNRALVSVRGPHARRGLVALAEDASVAGVRGRGAPLGESVGDYDDGLPVSASSFAQASIAGNQALRAVVAEAIGPRLGAALELYAGGGNLTRDIAAVAKRVVAIEAAEMPHISRPNLEWRVEGAAEACADLVARRAVFDVVVLDPPRSGAADCIDSIAALTDRVVYVSCDPATLGRDIGNLIERGFRLERVVPLDLMPQTSHVEVVAVLEKAAPTASA